MLRLTQQDPNRTPTECEEWVSFLREALLSTPKTIAKRRWAMLARDMGTAARPLPHRTFYLHRTMWWHCTQ